MQRARRGPGSHWQCTPQLPLFSMCSNTPESSGQPDIHPESRAFLLGSLCENEQQNNHLCTLSALSTTDDKKCLWSPLSSSFHTGNYVSFPVFYILKVFHLFSKRVFSILLPILHIKKFKSIIYASYCYSSLKT